MNHRAREIQGTIVLVEERYKMAKVLGDEVLAKHYLNVATTLLGLKGEIERREYRRVEALQRMIPKPTDQYVDDIADALQAAND